jgi:hypothetical protein
MWEVMESRVLWGERRLDKHCYWNRLISTLKRLQVGYGGSRWYNGFRFFFQQSRSIIIL